MTFDKGTIVRAVLFVLAWVNNVLASKGYKTIPVLDESTVATVITIIITAYAFYKNNIFGKKGKDLKNEIVKDAEVVIEKAIETKTSKIVAPVTPIPVQPAQPVKVEQPITPAPVVTPTEPVQPITPVQQDNQPK
jgi:SPP1 family holin